MKRYFILSMLWGAQACCLHASENEQEGYPRIIKQAIQKITPESLSEEEQDTTSLEVMYPTT